MRRFFLLALLCLAGSLRAQRLSPLAPAPDWRELEAYQETITRAEFTRLLENIYAPNQAAAGLIEIGENTAIIRQNLTPGDTSTLRFAKEEKAAHAN